MNVTFQQVKDYLKANTKHSVEKLIDATEPFVMDYINRPYGFAETDNVYDIQELTAEIDDAFYYGIGAETDGRIRKGLLNDAIKRETTRWKEGRNAGFYGRHIGRLAYLLTQQSK